MSLAVVESPQRSLEEDSFIILGTTPTPSLEHFSLGAPVPSEQPASVVEREIAELTKSLSVSKMETSTQLDSTTFSLLANGATVLNGSTIAPQTAKPSLHESSSPKVSMIASTESMLKEQRSVKGSLNRSLQSSIENKENVPRDQVLLSSSTYTQPPPTASFILGETQSILQQFPSLAQSSVSFEEVQLLQKLSMEHSQLKESLQRANVAMRKNFVSIQHLQDETKARYAEQDARIEEQKQKIDELSAENTRLVAELEAFRAAASEKQKELKNANVALQAEMEEVGRVREVERQAAQSEVDELRKESSERQAIVQNLSQHIERLELQIKGYVVVQNNKPESGDGAASFVSQETHKRELKAIERRLSAEVAKNLEFEDMRTVYMDEIECLKTNVKAAEQMYAATRVEAQQMFDNIKSRDDTIQKLREEISTLQERVQMLTVQSDIFQKDFEAERTAREQLAGEKSRILSEFEVLQRRSVELTAQLSQTESDREQAAERAAIMVQKATSSQEARENRSSPEQMEEKEPLSLLRCPLCLKGYKDFSSLQSHAADCMGIE